MVVKTALEEADVKLVVLLRVHAKVLDFVKRDGLVRTAELLPEPPATDHWSLEINPAASSAASGRRRRWLGLELS